MTAPLDIAAVRAEWAAANDTFPDRSLHDNLAVFADRWAQPLLDHVEMLERVLRQIAYTEVHSSADYAKTILSEVTA